MGACSGRGLRYEDVGMGYWRRRVYWFGKGIARRIIRFFDEKAFRIYVHSNELSFSDSLSSE